MSELAFNDATGAIVTVGVLGIAMGTGEFSIAASLFDLLKQAVVGIVAGALFNVPRRRSRTSAGRSSLSTRLRQWSR